MQIPKNDWLMIQQLVCKSFVLALLAVLLASCAANQIIDNGDELLLDGKLASALVEYERATEAHKAQLRRTPGFETRVLQRRQAVAAALARQALAERDKGNYEASERFAAQALGIDPSNERASSLAAEASRAKWLGEVLSQGLEAFKNNNIDLADALAQQVLVLTPRAPAAVQLKRQVDEAKARQLLDIPKLRDMYGKPISVEFKEANVRQIFEAFSKTTGINFVLDRDVRSDLKTSIFLRDTAFEEAVDLILLTTQLEKRILSKNSILVYPSNAAKQREYQDLMLRAFYLNHHDAKTVSANLKAVLKLKDVQFDERINAIFVRDTPETIALTERFIAMQDLSEPEVMLEVEVIEVGSNRLLDIGIQYPSQFSISPLSMAGKTGAMLLDEVRGFNRSRAQTDLGSITINARKADGWSNVLANPRIRSKNRDKAKILIGDKVPVITTTTSQGVVAENIQYVEVGIKLEVEPTIYLQDEVALKVNLEVSSVAREIRSPSGAVAYQIGTRSATTSIRLNDGETQIMGGLISNDERSSAARIPGLGDLPILGRLFGSESNTRGKSEIVLAITPRLIRNIERPSPFQERIWTGTEAQLRLRPLYIREAAPIQAVGSSQGSGNSSAQTVSVVNDTTNASRPVIPAAVPEPTVVQLRWQDLATKKESREFEVKLAVESNGGLRSLPLQIGFDKDAIEIREVIEGDVFKKDPGGANFSNVVDRTNGLILLGYTRTGAIGKTNTGTVITIKGAVKADAKNASLRMVQASVVTDSGRIINGQMPPLLDVRLP